MVSPAYQYTLLPYPINKWLMPRWGYSAVPFLGRNLSDRRGSSTIATEEPPNINHCIAATQCPRHATMGVQCCTFFGLQSFRPTGLFNHFATEEPPNINHCIAGTQCPRHATMRVQCCTFWGAKVFRPTRLFNQLRNYSTIVYP